MKKATAIYARRSVSDKDKDNNSLSINSQIEDCKKFIGESEKFHVYCDDGISAKDIHNRPEFQRMMSDIRAGLIGRIIVKKYDRFSRSTRDFLNVTHELDAIGVTILSINENIDTSTDAGKMVRNNMMNFAEYERAMIASRVTDAYNTKALTTGFYQGGKVYYGYKHERRAVNGKMGSVLVESDKAYVVRKAFELYKDVNVSLSDIIAYFIEKKVDINVKRKALSKTVRQAKKVGDSQDEMSNMDRSHFSKILESPLYVRADSDVYKYLLSEGYEIIDDVEAFDGKHGLFRHKKPNAKATTKKGGTYYIKVGYHEGLVDSKTWLAVQDKKSKNSKIPNNANAINSWLVGLTKCPYCGFGFYIYYSWNVSRTIKWRYYGDRGIHTSKGCEGKKKRLQLKPNEVEEIVFNAMKERIEQLEIAKTVREKPDTEAQEMQAEVIRIDNDIRDIMEKVPKVDDIMLSYLNKRVKELHTRKEELEEGLRARARKRKVIDTTPLIEPLNNWEIMDIEQKNVLAKTMIEVVYISDENGVDIKFNV